MKIKTLLAFTAFTFSISAVSANDELRGCYSIKSGTGGSSAIPLNPMNSDSIEGSFEQMGQYEIHLIKAKSTNKPKAALKMDGPFKGEIIGQNEYGITFLNHVLGSSDKAGLIFTSNDVAIPLGFPDKKGQIPISEAMNPVKGTGKFKYLDSANSNIQVNGVINMVTGKNQFDGMAGTLCFK
ncbi:MAG: hypothetical protein Q7U98_00645 [Methylicorpusculum sp.]|uniref:hypothetical protein n=1 Tax=Methylicorpusculum sp. TaxID=2713644 RepID=UPI002721AF1A|nr:hypothetical protein [Methylicorpusculum sp.]MDO8937648.1 hypothetical protein [Methylicorpusculum sp.]MDP2201975.1 hypothetical protein [Methylicorpusculum sp.]